MDPAFVKNRVINSAILVIAIIIAAQLYNSQLKQMGILRRQQEEERKKNQVLENIGKLEKKVESYSQYLSEKDTGEVMNTLNTLAQEYALDINSIRPGAEQNFRDYIKRIIYMEVSSPDYHSLGRFISRLESFQDILIVERMHIRSDVLSKNLVADMTVATVSIPD